MLVIQGLLSLRPLEARADHITVDLVAKSSIMPITPLPTVTATGDYNPGGLGFPELATNISNAQSLVQFADDINARFSEDPESEPGDDPALDRRDGTHGQYRIASFVRVEYDCTGPNSGVQNFHWTKRVSDVGVEAASQVLGALLLPPEAAFFASPVQNTAQYLFTNPSSADPAGPGITTSQGTPLDFNYALLGRPNQAANWVLAFKLKPRTNTYIAHSVVARVKCVGTPVLAMIDGTFFPSHRLYVHWVRTDSNGKVVSSDDKSFLETQQTMDNLWAEADPLVFPSGLQLTRMRPNVINPTDLAPPP